MKKILSALLLALAICTLDAQENDRPDMWLGGEISFGEFSTHDMTFAPSWGMLFNENLGFGALTAFSVGNNAYSFGLEPYIRYYVPVVENFSFFSDGYMGIAFGDDFTNLEEIGEFFEFSVGIRLGLQYWFTPSWSIAATTRLVNFSYHEDAHFGIGVDFTGLGLSFFWHF